MTKRKSAAKGKSRAKKDSFFSAVTGLGIEGLDKRTSLKFGVSKHNWLSREELISLYGSEGISANAVDVLPEEALDKGIEVIIKDQPGVQKKINDFLKKHKILQKLTQAGKTARLFGGAGILIGCKDGQDPTKPLNLKKIQQFKYVQVLSRAQLWRKDINKNPNSEFFGQPTQWRIGGPHIQASATDVYVHPSRILPFHGVWLPEEVSERLEAGEGLGWGSSILQRAYQPILNLVSTYDNISTLIQEYHQAVFQIKNLSELLAEGEEGLRQLQERLRQVQYGRSTVNAMILDGDETFTTQTVDLRGLADITSGYVRHVAGVTRTPVTKLMGQSPDGMNATGESDSQNWDRTVGSYQEHVLLEPLEYIITCAMYAADGPTAGVFYEFEVKFVPLREMTAAEEAELKAKQGEVDQIYITNGVVDPREIRQSRFGGVAYSTETKLIEGMGDELSASEEENAEAEGAINEETASKGKGMEPAQISVLIDVSSRISAGQLTTSAALALLRMAFPDLDDFRLTELVNGSVKKVEEPNAVDISSDTPE